MLTFFPEWILRAIHSAQDLICFLLDHFFICLLLPSLKVDADVGTDVHLHIRTLSQWAAHQHTLLGFFFSAHPNSSVGKYPYLLQQSCKLRSVVGPDSGVLSASHTDLVELFTQGQIIQGGKMEESHSLTTRYDFSMAVSFFFFFFSLQPCTHFENTSFKTITFSDFLLLLLNSPLQKGFFTTWKCSGFPSGVTSSARAEAHDSLRYLARHYPMLFASSSLKIRDDGTHFAGHTLPLFLLFPIFSAQPKKAGLLWTLLPSFFTRVATSSCGKKLTIFSQSHPWVARWPTWEVHPLRHSTAVAWPGALVEKRHRRTSTGDGGRGVKATATGTATHKHGAHSSPLPGLEAIATSLPRRFLLHPSDQHRHHLHVAVCPHHPAHGLPPGHPHGDRSTHGEPPEPHGGHTAATGSRRYVPTPGRFLR